MSWLGRHSFLRRLALTALAPAMLGLAGCASHAAPPEADALPRIYLSYGYNTDEIEGPSGDLRAPATSAELLAAQHETPTPLPDGLTLLGAPDSLLKEVRERVSGSRAAACPECKKILPKSELDDHLAKEHGYELAVLVVTDIAEHHSLVLAAGDPAFVANIPYERIDASLYNAPGVVSRKKQIFPAVCQALRRAV